MPDVEHLDDLVACKLCFALTTREGRVLHLDWHARLNARVYGWPDKIVSIGKEMTEDGEASLAA